MPDHEELLGEIEALTLRLREAEDTLEAIRSGQVDALVVVTPEAEEQLFTLEGADRVYRIFLESITEGAVTLSEDGVVLYANEAAARLLRPGGGTPVGEPFRRNVRADHRERFDALLDAALRQPASAEIRLRGRTGGRPVYISLQFLSDPQVVVAILTDLTDIRKTEMVLEAERLASTILEQTSEAIVVCDTKGQIIRASRAVRELAGASPLFRAQAEALPLVTADGDAWRPPTDDPVEPVKGLEVILERPDGGVRHLVMNVDPLRTQEEGFIGSVITLTDITERKRMEEELRHALAESRSLTRLLDESAQPFGAITPDGRITLVNRSFEELTGYSVDELKRADHGWSEVLTPPEWRGQEAEVRAEVALTGQPRRYEQVFARKDGSQVPVELLSHVAYGGGGEPELYYSFVTDLTERRRAEETAQRAGAEKAAEAERLRLARDLHDSVTQALFAASLKAEALTVGGAVSGKACDVVDDVSRLSRGALAQMRTLLLELRGEPVEAVPIRQLLRTVVEATEGRCSARVSLEIEGDDDLPQGVHVAVYRIAQEALNNVARHARAANVWVRLDMSDHGLMRLVVGDDGAGFERRNRDPSHMGLASMEERAREVGADLLVRSHPGEGTIVTLVWRRPSTDAA